MEEAFQTQDFRDQQRRQLERARLLTNSVENAPQYNYLQTPLAKYEEKLFDGRPIMSLIEEAYQRHPDEAVAILDYGCGHNAALRELVGNNTTGIPIQAAGMSAGDPRTEEERLNDTEKRITFIDQETVAFSLPDESYDIIVSKMTFGHLINPLQVMKKLYRALRPEGELFIELRQTSDLAKRFFPNEDESFEPEKMIIDDLVASGIDIKTDGEKFVIRKNSDRYPKNCTLSSTLLAV